MKEEQYKDFIEDDIVGAIIMFQQMSVPNRIKAVLYLLDNIDVQAKNVRNLLKDNVGKELLMMIRTANKEHYDGKSDDGVIAAASELYYEKYPDERPTELEAVEINEEIEELEKEKVKNFYRLLT